MRAGKVKNEDILYWLKRWDLDQDGKFSKEEFKNMVY